MSDSDEAKGLSPVPRPLTGVRTQPPARRRLGVNPRFLRHGQSEYWTVLLLRPTRMEIPLVSTTKPQNKVKLNGKLSSSLISF